LAITKVDIIVDNYKSFWTEGSNEQQEYLRVGIIGGDRPPLLIRKGMYIYEGIIPDYINAISHAMKMKYSIFHFDSISDANEALFNNEIDIIAPSVPNDNTINSCSSSYYYDDILFVSNVNSALHKNSYKNKKTDKNIFNGIEFKNLNLRASLAHLAYGNGPFFLSNESSLTYELNYNLRKKVNIDKTPLKFELKLEVNKKNENILNKINEAINKTPQDIKSKIAKKWEVSFKNISGSGSNILEKNEKEWLSLFSDIYILVDEDTPPPILLMENKSYSGVLFDTLIYANKTLNKNIIIEKFNNKESMMNFAKKHSNSFIVKYENHIHSYRKNFSTSDFFSSPIVLVTEKNKSIENTKTIAVSGSDKIHVGFPPHISRMKIYEVPKAEDAFRLLQNGYVDGVITSQISYLFHKNNGFRNLNISYTFPQKSLSFSFDSLSESSIPASTMNKALINISPEITNQIKKKWQIFHFEKTLSVILLDYFNELIIFLFYLFSIIFILSQRLILNSREKNKLTHENLNLMWEINKKENYLTKISHELRTPLNAIIGLLEIEVNNNNKSSENISLAWESGRHLLSLASNIIDLNKIELGFYKTKPQHMSLEHSIVKLVDLYQVIATKKNLKIYYNLEISNDTIIFDLAVFNQIIGNLLSNAIKFTKAGEININLFQDDYVPVNGRAKFGIEICDTGIGISEEDQVKIFEPFEQVKTSNANLGSDEYSSGLGLSICKELLSLVNGSITVDSTVGIGTIFTIFIEAEVSPERITPVESEVDITSEEKTRILIVDDHVANSKLLTQQLSMLGFIVESASSGNEAYDLWRNSNFDVVITDCNMIGGNGFDLSEKIRNYEFSNQLPRSMIIGLTASSNEIYEKCIKSGMDDCLFKPLDINKLQSSLKKMLIKHPTNINLGPTISNESSLKYFTDIIECNTNDLVKIKQAVLEKNNDMVYQYVHSLKGSALVSNHSSLIFHCKSIESHLSQGKPLQAELINELELEVFRVNDSLRAEINEKSNQNHSS